MENYRITQSTIGRPRTFSETVLKDASLREARAFLLGKFNLYTGLNCMDWETACAMRQKGVKAEGDSLQIEDVMFSLLRDE